MRRWIFMPISRRVRPNVLGKDSGLHLASALSSSQLSAHIFHLFFVSIFRFFIAHAHPSAFISLSLSVPLPFCFLFHHHCLCTIVESLWCSYACRLVISLSHYYCYTALVFRKPSLNKKMASRRRRPYSGHNPRNLVQNEIEKFLIK